MTWLDEAQDYFDTEIAPVAWDSIQWCNDIFAITIESTSVADLRQSLRENLIMRQNHSLYGEHSCWVGAPSNIGDVVDIDGLICVDDLPYDHPTRMEWNGIVEEQENEEME